VAGAAAAPARDGTGFTVSVILLVFLGAVFLLIAVLYLPVAFAGRAHLTEKVSGEGELACE